MEDKNMIITKEQMTGIEKLIPEHKDALIAYGADMYRSGMIKGEILIAVGAFLGATATIMINYRKKK